MLDRRNRRRSLQFLKDEDCVGCTVDSVHLYYASGLDRKAVWLGEGVILSKAANIHTAIVWPIVVLTKTIRTLVTYVLPFDEEYGTQFFDMQFLNFVVHRMFLKFLALKFSIIYIRYTTNSKMVIKRRVVPSLLLNFSRNVSVEKSLSITQCKDPSLNTSS